MVPPEMVEDFELCWRDDVVNGHGDSHAGGRTFELGRMDCCVDEGIGEDLFRSSGGDPGGYARILVDSGALTSALTAPSP